MKRISLKLLALSLALAPSTIFAAQTGLPWERPMALILASVVGPIGYSVGALMIAGVGAAGFYFHQHSEQFSKFAGTVMAVAALVGASPFIVSLFGVTGCLI